MLISKEHGLNTQFRIFLKAVGRSMINDGSICRNQRLPLGGRMLVAIPTENPPRKISRCRSINVELLFTDLVNLSVVFLEIGQCLCILLLRAALFENESSPGGIISYAKRSPEWKMKFFPHQASRLE